MMASDNPNSQIPQTPQASKGTSNRGFASMDPQRQRQIASEGGKAAHEKGTAHEFTSEEARAAGRKGGQARSEKRSANLANSSNASPTASTGSQASPSGSTPGSAYNSF